MRHNIWLLAGGAISYAAALFHVIIMVGGADWYLLAGAGEQLAAMAAEGHAWPVLLTSMITVLLFLWTLLAWSAAGLLPALPLLGLAIPLITLTYALRGIGGLLSPWLAGNTPWIMQSSSTFWLLSSSACLLAALLHGLGLLQQRSAAEQAMLTE